MNSTQTTIINSLAIAGLFVMIKPETLTELFVGLILFFIAMFIKPLFLNDVNGSKDEV